MLLSDAKRELQELKASLRKAQKESEEQEVDKQARIPHVQLMSLIICILIRWSRVLTPPKYINTAAVLFMFSSFALLIAHVWRAAGATSVLPTCIFHDKQKMPITQPKRKEKREK